jgi:hypothetical protein
MQLIGPSVVKSLRIVKSSRTPVSHLQAELEESKRKELMGAIQSHFREWLLQTGGMRQVYDLARLEREEIERS